MLKFNTVIKTAKCKICNQVKEHVWVFLANFRLEFLLLVPRTILVYVLIIKYISTRAPDNRHECVITHWKLLKMNFKCSKKKFLCIICTEKNCWHISTVLLCITILVPELGFSTVPVRMLHLSSHCWFYELLI